MGILVISLCMILCQALFVVPETSYAESAGDILVVRVQYAGERADKIREKARFTKSQLAAMGTSTLNYSNVTDVGTVMGTIAKGPKLSDVIAKAGVDMGSIKYLTFRTTDGGGEHQRYSVNFTIDRHVTATRYYYPNLRGNYERNDNEALTPLDGALEGRQTVPSILALESSSTKQPDMALDPSMMTTESSYRFCLGQTSLQENKKTSKADVSSPQSAQYIFGIDLTLYGSPVKGISLNLDEKNLKVGSQKKISAMIEGDELFENDWGFTMENLVWSSSDRKIASVDEHGMITVKKAGTVTITAAAPNGMTASVTINTIGSDEEKPAEEKTAAGTQGDDNDNDNHGHDSQKGEQRGEKADAKKDKPKKAEAAGIIVKEVKLGGVLDPELQQDEGRQQMASDAQALDQVEEASPEVVLVSAFTAILIFFFGLLMRIDRYFKEV